MDLDYLTHLRNDSARFLSLLRDADPAQLVPSCPEWTADDLLWHLAEVQWFWGTIVSRRLQDGDEAEKLKPERPTTHDGLVSFFDESSAALQTVLADTDPGVEVWMWSDDKTVGYIRRRQAHEALIHRLDAELTVGDVTPLDAELATDGIHEVMTKMYGEPPEWATVTPGELSVSLETSDTGLVLPLQSGRWSGTSPNTGNTYDEPYFALTDDSGAPDARVRGTAPDLDAWLWSRGSAASLSVEGSPTAFALLEEVVRIGIQ